MKKSYITPSLTVIQLEYMDILAASTSPSTGDALGREHDGHDEEDDDEDGSWNFRRNLWD